MAQMSSHLLKVSGTNKKQAQKCCGAKGCKIGTNVYLLFIALEFTFPSFFSQSKSTLNSTYTLVDTHECLSNS